MHAWDKMTTYAGRGSFIGWLLKVAYSRFLQSKRKSKRYAEVLERAGHVADAESRTHALLPTDTADLDRLLAVLTEDERAIMIMSYACGLSHREISAATEQPVGTVKSIIFRAKDKIRTRFEIEDHQHG